MQTIVSLKSSKLNIPNLIIHPECFFIRIGNALGMQDIDFESHPEFSKMFVLKGDDEEAIRNFLRPEVLEYFENHRGISLEASGDTLFFYFEKQRTKPNEIKDLLSQAYDMFDVLIARA